MCLGTSYWMGALDDVKEGEWRWQSDKAVLSNFSTLINSVLPWSTGDPSSSTSTNCLYWDPSSNRLYDSTCATYNYYICEHFCMPLLILSLGSIILFVELLNLL